MEIILGTTEELAELAADAIAARVLTKPELVLGLATGSSPLPLYEALARRVSDGLDMSRVRGFALDEYVGIPADHPESYLSVIRREVVGPLGMDPDLVLVPDGRAADLAAAGADYEERIAAAGGIDLQVLGIGANGHIGFNEPGSSLSSRTRIKTLTKQTREDNARFFGGTRGGADQVPTHCISQGLGTILDADRVFLFAAGSAKAAAVAGAVEGPVTASCPGSVLQFHRHAAVFVDHAAAARLERLDYYVHTWMNKPAWQQL